MYISNTMTMARNAALDKLDQVLGRQSKLAMLLVICTIQILLVYGDYATGPWVPFSVFYLITLYFAVKYLGVTTSLVMACVIVMSKTAIRVTHADVYSHIIWWQIMIQVASSLTIYIFFCYLIKNQISARKQLERTARAANQRAGEAEHQLVNISEEVQQRIGRELHDDLGQQLTGIAFKAHLLSSNLQSSGNVAATEAQQITDMINLSISKTRGIAHGLYPAEIEERGLSGMLEKFSDYIAATYMIKCTFARVGEDRLEKHDVDVHLFRITQEAVSNAIKHGKAREIKLRLVQLQNTQSLEIVDNGIGINIRDGASTNGLGLRSMRYRADLIGATLEISNGESGGCKVLVMLAHNEAKVDE